MKPTADAAVPQPVAVVGCGLIGASLAAAWSQAGLEVWGHDRRDLGELLERGWIRRQVAAEQLAAAPVVVLALPVPAILAALRRLPWDRSQLVTDTGGVKRPMHRLLPLPSGARFVGGHPLAGGTGSGWESADPELFRGARWAITAEPAAPGVAEVAALARRAGARPLHCDAEQHDRVVALTSHLPQLLATALAAELETVPGELAVELLGSGGRGLLRLAASPYALWQGILEANGEEVQRALAAVAARASQPPQALEEDFAAARRFARRLEDGKR